MPRRFTALALVNRIKEMADKENDDQISLAQWKQRMSLVYGTYVYGEAGLAGYRYFEYEEDIVCDGSESYDEPSDHLSTVSIRRVIDASSHKYGRPLLELAPQESDRFSGQTSEAVAYELIDDQIYLYPNPSTGTYKWRYVAQPPDLGTYADGDLIDVICPAGESVLIWGTISSGLSKSESDQRNAEAQMEKARDELRVWLANRTIEGRRRADGVDLDDLTGIRPPDGRW